jgi:hypothetical protein
VPQLAPSAFGVPATQRDPPVTATHVSVPLHGSPSLQAAFVLHESAQFDSQPVFGPLPDPRSHSSPESTIPSPHVPAVQAPP